MRLFARPRVPLMIVAFLVPTILLLSATPSSAEASRESQVFQDWLDDKEAFYTAHPELMDTKGSGWKPYNRMKWFHEQRMTDGELPAAGARWKVWERKRELEARAQSRGGGAGGTWFSLGPFNFAGRILSMAFDPTNTDILYVGSAGGGLWKTVDDGSTWTPLTDELPSLAVGGVAVSLSDPSIVVIGTGEATNNIDRIGGVGILRSTDAGLTWNTTNVSYAVNSGHGFHHIETNPITGTMLAGATDGLWRSTDDGANWDHVRTVGQYYDVKWKPGDANRVYTVRGSSSQNSSNVKVSTDDGVTWTKAGTGQPFGPDIGKSKIAVTPADPSRVYAIFVNLQDADLLGVYRTDDDGANWTLTTTTPNIPGQQGWYNLSLTADANNADRVIAGGVQLYRSNNAGVSFSTIGNNVHVDHHTANYVPGTNDEVWVGSDGGMYKSSNDGTSWADKNDGLVTYQFYDICVNNGPTPYYVMGGTQDNGTDKWSGTSTWSNGLFADGMVCNIDPVNGTTVYAEIQFGSHYRNTNSGNGGWTQINNGISGGSAWVTPVSQDQSDGSHLYTSSLTGVYRTTNGGNFWEEVDTPGADWLDISPVDGNVIWTVVGQNPPRFTTDDGNSWTSSANYGFSRGNAKKVHAHPTDVNTALVTFGGYAATNAHIAITTDMGASWTDVSGDFPAQPVNTIIVDPGRPGEWYIGTDVGIWKTDNGGTNWVPFGTGFPNTVVEELEIQRALRKMVAGTHGRGAWEIDLPPAGVTNVGDGIDVAARNLLFDPPSPNPIRDRTLFRYAAKSDTKVRLSIYDIQGRVVSQLEEFDRGDGVVRTTPWITEDVPSGVYFAVLEAGAERRTHKLIVRK